VRHVPQLAHLGQVRLTSKAALRKLLRHGRGIQYAEHTEGVEMFKAYASLA
jgi:hypothetical protein